MPTIAPSFRLNAELSQRVLAYLSIRFMSSKFRLLLWINDVSGRFGFETVLDASSGFGCGTDRISEEVYLWDGH